MPARALNRTEDFRGVFILVSALIVCLVGAFIFSQNNTSRSLGKMTSKEKYPARAFVLKRQGSERTKTRYRGVAAAAGLEVNVDFDKSEQNLKLKIKDRNGKALPYVALDVRASRAGRARKQKRFNMKTTNRGEYQSGPMGLSKGGWVLMVTAYDQFKYEGEKLLFHTEKSIFLE